MPGWLLLLVLGLPAAYVVEGLGGSPVLVFVFAGLALVPLAALISVATDALAERMGHVVGGLLNATFGNAAELIIGVLALSQGLTEVVRASIAGSVIGNSLLVLGMAMLAGGWRHPRQTFNGRDAGQYAALLAMAVVGLVIPTLTATLGGSLQNGTDVPDAPHVQVLTDIVAVLLLLAYAAYVAHAVFGLRAVNDAAQTKAPAPRSSQRATPERTRREVTRGGSALFPRWIPDQARPGASVAAGVVWLSGATVLTALASELLVGAIEPVAHQVGLSPFFIGLVVLPILGNAGEHVSAITQALQNHMDATMAITAGSAIQVALLLAPVLALISVPLGHPLNFIFIPLELVIFFLVAFLYALVSLDGESTWLEGLLLLVFYAIVAVSAFFIPR